MAGPFTDIFSPKISQIPLPTSEDWLTKLFGNISNFGKTASSFLSKTVSNIPVATPASLVTSLIGKVISDEQDFEQQKRLDDFKKERTESLNKSIIADYPTQGITTNSFYKALGGDVVPQIMPKYKAENKEIIMHEPSDIIKTDENGTTEKLADGVSEFKGDTHESPSEGIGVSHEKNAFIFSDDLKIPENVLKSILKKYKL